MQTCRFSENILKKYILLSFLYPVIQWLSLVIWQYSIICINFLYYFSFVVDQQSKWNCISQLLFWYKVWFSAGSKLLVRYIHCFNDHTNTAVLCQIFERGSNIHQLIRDQNHSCLEFLTSCLLTKRASLVDSTNALTSYQKWHDVKFVIL